MTDKQGVPTDTYGQPPAYPGAQGQPYASGAYPAQGQAYQQPPPYYSTAATVVIQQPTVIKVGEVPMTMNCPHCQEYIITDIDHRVGLMTWAAAGLLCLFGLGLGCCLIPFCIRSLKDVVHTCPKCNNEIGRRDKLQNM